MVLSVIVPVLATEEHDGQAGGPHVDWSILTPMPSNVTAVWYPLAQFPMVPLGDTIYTVGGISMEPIAGNAATSLVTAYNTSNQTWAASNMYQYNRVLALMDEVQGHGLAAVGTTLYAIGGYIPGDAYTHDSYYPHVQWWDTAVPIPYPTPNQSANEIFWNTSRENKYQHTTMPPMVTPRFNFAMEAVGTVIYTIAGFANITNADGYVGGEGLHASGSTRDAPRRMLHAP